MQPIDEQMVILMHGVEYGDERDPEMRATLKRPVVGLGEAGMIAATLAAVGLKVHWDGKLERRIGVTLNWQRRWEGAVPTPMKRWPF